MTPEQRKEARAADRRRRQENKDDLAWLLSTPQGRRYILRWVSRCGILRAGYEGNGSRAYFDAGQRYIGSQMAREVGALRPELLTELFRVPPEPADAEDEDDDAGD